MNYFLLLIILGLCGGGYYEYTIDAQIRTENQQQITDLGAKNDSLQAENKKLEDANAQLTKSVTDTQAEIGDLTKQVQDAQVALAQAKAQATQTSNAGTATNAGQPPPPSHPTNNLGTITTLGGKTFQNCQLLKVEADGIVVNHADGITKIQYGLLPPDMQKKFGYDPHQSDTLTDAQVQFQEEQRKAAVSGN